MSFISNLFTIALPIILQNFLSSFVNMLDTIMVGGLGHVDIAAVGLGNQVFFVMNIMVFGAVSGGSIFISQYWGKKDLEGIHRTTGIMLVVAMAITCFFFLVSALAPEFCISLYSNDDEVIKKGAVYLRIVSPSFIMFGLSFAFSNAERSTEHVRLPAVATIISVVLNGILNYVFIFGINIRGVQCIPALGIVGAAVATIISRVVEAVIVVYGAYVRKFEVAVSFKKYFTAQPDFLRKYIKVCLPVLFNETLWGVGISMQSSIFAHSGTVVIAAFNINGTISNLLWPVCMGFGSATSIIIGKTIGQGNHDKAKSLAKILCGFNAAWGLVLGIILIPLTKTLPFFFRVEPVVIKMAAVFLTLKACSFPFDAFNMSTVVGVFRSGGDTLFAMLIDVGFMWVISIPLGWLGVLVWNLPYWGVYLVILIEPLLKMILGLYRLFSGKWLRDVTKIE